MTKDQIILTKEGYDKIKIRLQQLEEVERKKVAEDIKEAQSFGDISENAEFDDARNRQAMLEQEVGELKHILQNAKIVSKASIKDKITIGSLVSLKFKEGLEKYEIVGDLEADPLNAKISYQSPIGRALMGQAKNAVIYIATPRGKREAKIVEIS